MKYTRFSILSRRAILLAAALVMLLFPSFSPRAEPVVLDDLAARCAIAQQELTALKEENADLRTQQAHILATLDAIRRDISALKQTTGYTSHPRNTAYIAAAVLILLLIAVATARIAASRSPPSTKHTEP